MPHTPNFDKAISAILADLGPHSRPCRFCDKPFEIFAADLEFYQKMQVPPPTLCPDCRHLRRSVYRNARNLFERKDASGRNVISVYRAGSPFTVMRLPEYSPEVRRDLVKYGQDYDPARSFFDQFRKLQLATPRPALSGVSEGSVNSEYINNAGMCKNCYMCFLGGYSENVMYATWFMNDKDSLDLLQTHDSELCYECVYCGNCYDLNFGYFCSQCRNSWFLYDCVNCQNCFGCVNLRHKKYCWFNEELPAAEYQKRLAGFNSVDYQTLEAMRKTTERFIQERGVFESVNFGEQSENCTGNLVFMSKNCRDCFDVMKSEQLAYSRDVLMSKDCLDTCYNGLSEKVLESVAGGDAGYNTRYSMFTGGKGRDMEYCDNCRGCSNCFGCVGLSNQKFCVLNKLYGEKEYFELVDKIKCAMLARKEYGEFFPLVYANHSYLDSCALEDFKLTAPDFNKIIKKENQYYGVERKSEMGYGEPKINLEFKIQKPELVFYQKKSLPLPRLHPEVRHQKRSYWRGSRHLRKSNCVFCQKSIDTAYPEGFIGKICCRACYLSHLQ